MQEELAAQLAQSLALREELPALQVAQRSARLPGSWLARLAPF